MIGGHEPAGIITAAGLGVPKDWIGRSVMVHHYLGCGMCDQCRSGWTQMCRNGATAMGATAAGSHADLIAVPLSTISPMPEGLSYMGAASISCGTGTAWGALRRLQLRGSDTIAISGQGPVGLAATQLAAAVGARVIALDLSPERLECSRQFGAVACLDPSAVGSVADAIRDLSGGRGVSKSLETSGASTAARAALEVLDLWGSACWVGVGSTINFEVTELLYRQITAMTSWTMSVPAMQECARFVAQEAYGLFDKQTSGKGVVVAGAH